METNPEGTAQIYIFLVDNQDIALNIVMSGYQALCLVQEDDGYYFSADSFIEEMRAIQFTGSCQCAYELRNMQEYGTIYAEWCLSVAFLSVQYLEV